jgi:hypothetical protein
VRISTYCILTGICLLPAGAAFGQALGLQQENSPSLLQGTGGLPQQRLGFGNLANGYASLDSLPTVQLAASYGLGVDNGRWFDANAGVRFRRLSVSLWTSGLTARLSQPQPTVSTLQRRSTLGLHYTFNNFAVFGGVAVHYLSINATAKVQLLAPTLTVETQVAHYRLGLRLSNFTFSRAQSEGILGTVADSTLQSREVKSALDGPAQAQLYSNHTYKYGQFTATPALGIGLNLNSPTPYQRFGDESFGVSTVSSLQVGYRSKLFFSVARKVAQERKLSQLSYGCTLRLAKLTLFYSSFNFYYFAAYRAHTLGMAIRIL